MKQTYKNCPPLKQKIQTQDEEDDVQFFSFIVENDDIPNAPQPDKIEDIQVDEDYFKKLSMQFYSIKRPSEKHFISQNKKQPKSVVDHHFYQMNSSGQNDRSRLKDQYGNHSNTSLPHQQGIGRNYQLSINKQGTNKDTVSTAASLLYNNNQSDGSFSKNFKISIIKMSPGRHLKPADDQSQLKKPSYLYKKSDLEQEQHNSSNDNSYGKNFKIHKLQKQSDSENSTEYFSPYLQQPSLGKLLQRQQMEQVQRPSVKNQFDPSHLELAKGPQSILESKEEQNTSIRSPKQSAVKMRPKFSPSRKEQQPSTQDQIYFQFGFNQNTLQQAINLSKQLMQDKKVPKYSFRPQVDLRSRKQYM